MFIRYREKPLTLQKLDALIPRLPIHHKLLSQLKTDAAKLQRGFNGERRLDYYLHSLPDDYSILSDVGLQLWNKEIQIDTLIFTPYAAYLLEVKNFEGTLTFDTVQRQLIQDVNQIKNTFSYPLTQADNTAYLMMQWLEYFNLPSIPIHSYIVLAQPSTMVRVHGDEKLISKYVMKTEEAAIRIIQNENEYQQHTQEDIQRRNQIVTKIMSQVHDFSIDIIKKYGIDMQDVLPGTICDQCSELSMKYYRGKWTCLACGAANHHAHEKTLNDFFLLYKNNINVYEAMNFLGIENRYTAYRLLKKTRLKYKHETRTWEQTKDKKN